LPHVMIPRVMIVSHVTQLAVYKFVQKKN